ncbi:SDR family oxidoreductase [Candidatus Dojkabacteria bacterium]|uniref:SDR family oxidoreductase n=1 Tax=Candidatus Dojkabacteria bacterium TaxID=2099670 RepID=A0A955L2F5_9BACT|nr:SDR family oxidoreductase [Candidatus Dojkabacteria bacterium]
MKSKTILITGSSRGIGKAVATLAYTEGYKVIIHGKTESKALLQTESELKDVEKLVFDITDKKATEKAISQWIKQNGTIDILINNAGVAKNFLSNIDEVEDSKAIEEYSTNILGTIHCIQAVISSMLKAKSGNIINIASIKGHPQLSTLSTLTYATTKAGVISLTKSLAKYYAEYGIRVNSISPGYIETDQVNDWKKSTFEKIRTGTLIGRIGQPEEIAEIVMFLASERSSYMTGEDILVDGGYKLKGK